MDLTQALIGAAPPDDSEDQRAIAAQLSRRNKLGLIAQLTGDKVIAPTGEGMLLRNQRQKEGLQLSRQKNKSRDVLDNYYQGTLKNNARRNDIMEESNRLDNLTKGQIARDRESYRQEKLDLAERQRLNTDIQRFDKVLNDRSIPAMSAAIQEVEDVLAPHKNADGTYKDDVPGVGGMSNVAVIGPIFAGEEGRNIQLTMAALYNSIIKDTSGAAVSGDEYVRLRGQLGTNPWHEVENQLEAYEIIKRAYLAKLDHTMKGRGVRAEKVLQGWSDSGRGTLFGEEMYITNDMTKGIPDDILDMDTSELSPEELAGLGL